MSALGQFHAGDAGEFFRHMRHPAFQPVAVELGDRLRQAVDQARPIVGDEAQDQLRGHFSIPVTGHHGRCAKSCECTSVAGLSAGMKVSVCRPADAKGGSPRSTVSSKSYRGDKADANSRRISITVEEADGKAITVD